MKRTISILVIIAMMLASVLAIIPVGATEGAEGGDSVVEDTTPVGTAVATADEFKAAVEAGKDFHLTANIILPADWAPKDFGATFDGNGKTITFVGTAGLFNVLKSATIKNVTLLGETELTSGIAINAEGDVRFENVTVGVTAIKANNASAFVGGKTFANLTFVNCANRAFVDGGLTGGAFVGWSAGETSAVVIEGCRNYGNVDADYAGGYIGAAQGASVTIKNSINGTEAAPVVVTDGSSYAGGIIGESFAVINIDGLEDYVTVKGGNYVSAVVSKTTKDITVKNTNVYETLTGGGTPGGGILAYVAGQDKITFRAEKVTVNGAHNVTGSWNRLNGGFVGHIGHGDDKEDGANTSSFYFVDCAMKATTPSGNCNFGGFFGGHHHSTGKWYEIVSFVRCTNFSDIVQGGNTGGFCGQGNAKLFYFEDCVNEGDVTSNNHMAGGFGSYGPGDTKGTATFIRCINNGTITSKAGGKHAAGFFVDRKLSEYTFKDCVNNGEIKAQGTAAAFATNCTGNATLITCVNKGTLAGGTNLEYTDRGENETILNSYLNATPTATTFDGAINVFFNDMTETKDTNWIGLVKEGEDSSTAWAYSKDLKTGFNVLDLPVAEGKTITGGYYNIYFVPNNKNLKDVLAPDSKDKLLADPIRVFIADGIISSAEDLKNTQPGGVYSLAADITLPEDYEPVDFSGYLDAVGHTITVTGKKGVFNKLSNATIKNLNVKADIKSDGAVGVLAVTAEGNVTIDNVVVSGTVKGTEVAGFIQYVDTADTTVTIQNSKNNANLTGTQKTAGFIAFTNKNAVIVIDNCVNNGAITRTCGHGKEAGDCKACGELGGAGFIANADVDSKITIKNSTNNGSVYGMGSMAGFAGYVFGTINLENCTNNGRIEVTNKITYLSSAAGLVGIFANGGSGTNVLTVKGCTNNSNIYFGDAGYEGGGGMVGSAKWNNSTEIYFEDCVNVGDLVRKNTGGHFGGFLGWASSIGVVSFKNCTNYGDIGTGTENNGGFLGQVGAKKVIYAENCTNYGNVTATTHTAGGFSGHCNDSTGATVTINGFTNYGTIISTNDTKAASACMVSCDSAANISIKNVTNYGYVSAKTSAAVAMAWGTKAVCENIVNNGKITGEKIVGEFTNNGQFGELIEINNAEEFLAMKPGFNYILMNNIVLPEDYWGGTFGSQWYTCELDGNGKTIYMKGLKSALFQVFHNVNVHDLKIVGTLSAKAALAGEVSNFAENVTVTNVVIDVDITHNARIGGFIEWLKPNDHNNNVSFADDDNLNVKFENCAFLGNINAPSSNRTGGFIAEWCIKRGSVTFNNCVVGDKGLDTSITGKEGRVAAFAGKLQGESKTDDVKVVFNNCVNYADVNQTAKVNEGASGAFGGRFVNLNVTLNNCDNYGNISTNKTPGWVQGTGGLLGEVNRNVTLTINDSNNYGDVWSNRSVVGGLVGAVTASSTATIKNSANYGNVENGSGWNFHAGGIVGAANGDQGWWHNNGNYLTVDNCQNYGTVTTSNANMGGIVGGIEGAAATKLLSVTNCANYGKMNILGGSNVGGIIGQGVSGKLTIVENNVNYGYISGATGGNGVGGIMAHPYATTSELILKNNANYGIVEGGANAKVAGILGSWDALANKYTYEGNVNYGTIIGANNKTSGIVVSVADKADSSFTNNYNYGIVVCAEGNLLAPSIPANVKAEGNYAGGVVVKNETNAALVKGLASPYNYDVAGAGRAAWMDLVKALAAAEGVEIPEDPSLAPKLVETVIDFTKLTYKAYAGKTQTVDAATGTVKDPVALTEYAKTAEHYKFTVEANTLRADHIGDAGTLFYMADQTLPINADTYYEYYVNAKNNRNTGYAGIPFAMANGVPYFLYGAFHNNSDIGDDVCEMRICAGRNDCELYVPGGAMKDTYVQASVKQDLVDGFGQMKIVIDGYTASFYTVSGGEWVKLVFANKDLGVSVDSVQLPEGSVFTPGSIFNRDGSANKQRTITVKDAKYLAPYTPDIDFTALDYIIRDYEGLNDVAEAEYTNLFTTTKTADVLATVPAAGNTDKDTDKNAKGYFAKLAEITEDSYYELTLKAKNNRTGGYCGFIFAADATNKPYMVYGALNNGRDNDTGNSELRPSYGHHADRLSNTYFIKHQTLDENGYASYKVVIDGFTATVYTLVDGQWTQVTFGSMTAYELPAGSYVAIGAYNRHGLDNQRTITIADAALAIVERTLSVEDAIAALINKTALNEAKVELAAMGDVAEDDAKAVALKAAIEAMEKATTQAEIDKAAEDYAAKEETIVDLSKLNYQLAEAEKYVQTNYTAGTWYEFAKALEAAKNVDKNDQTAVDAAAAALDEAIYGLADISELTSMTQKAIAAAEALLPEDYGTAGWAVMLEKLAVAKQAFADLDTDLMDKAVVDLYTAMDALISVKELKALLAELSALNPDDYSVISYAPVGSAIVVGLTTTDPVDQAPVDNALALLRAAKAGLVNVKDLVAAIAKAEDTNPSRYTEASYAKLLNVLSSAKLVVMAADEASEVADAKAAVEAAVNALRMKTRVNTKELVALIADAEAIDGTLYTAESWDAFKAALAAAKVAVYADTQGKVREAITALEEAMSALVEKPVISTDALAALIAEVEALDFTKYTTETWSAVSAALIEAKVALKADDQAVVDAAKAALDAAKAALAEKPVVEPDETDKPTEPTEPTDPKPTEPTQPTEPADKNEGGCGGAIGATVVVMTAVLGLGATVVLKKKED